MATKAITLKAISAEIGDMPKVSLHHAHLMVIGAEHQLGEAAFKLAHINEVTYPSNAALKRLAKQLQQTAR